MKKNKAEKKSKEYSVGAGFVILHSVDGEGHWEKMIFEQ